MPWTRRQVRFLESSGSPLTAEQKAKMNRELHNDPSMGHKKKGSEAMHKFSSTHITHHADGSHTVEHTPHMASKGKSGAFMEHGESTSYTAAHNEELMSKMHEHLGGGESSEEGEEE